jgi:hypothetical protein
LDLFVIAEYQLLFAMPIEKKPVLFVAIVLLGATEFELKYFYSNHLF